MLYYLIFLIGALLVSFLIFRWVAFAATEIARVFLALRAVLTPIHVFQHLARRWSRQ